MDQPTRIGLGATAIGTLAGLSAPILGWYVAGPTMLLCAAVAVWGFWPLLLRWWPSKSQSRPGSELLSVSEAARLIYAKASPRLRRMIRAESASAGSIDGWFRTALQVCAAARLIVLLGRPGVGFDHEAIPANLVGAFRWDDNDRLSDPYGGLAYSDILVGRDDVTLVWKHYEAEVID